MKGLGRIPPAMKLQSPPSGIEVEVEEVDFDSTSEPWATYKLSDGATLKVRVVVTKVVRFKDFDQHGDPIYQVFSNTVIRSTGVPPALKGKPLKPPDRPAPTSGMGVR